MHKTSIIPACFAVLLLFGCGGGSQKNAKVKIGLSIPTQREERWVRDLAQLREEAATFGVELLVAVSENDAGLQLAQCEGLLAQKINVLIVAPHDSGAASLIAEKAARQGVPIIAYDRLILNAHVDLYISFDSVKVGEMQARYLAKLAPRGKYVVLSGAPTDHNAALFRQGAMNILRPMADRGDIKIVMDQPVEDWRPERAERLTRAALIANAGDIQAVLAPNDGIAGGVIQALTLYRLAGKVPVTGQDAEAAAARRILAGTQAMTVFKDTRQLASAAFGAAMNFAAGGSAPVDAQVPNGKMNVPALLLEQVAIDRNNIGKVLIDGGYLSRDAVYGTSGD
jgi:D-xylose transport system substrate-binding protein